LTDSADLGTVVHKPGRELDDPKELLLGSLDYYRSVIIRKVDSLTDAQLRESRLPSGWTPLELLKHLSYMERRWLRCGFRAEQLPIRTATKTRPGAGTPGRATPPPASLPRSLRPASKRGPLPAQPS
jgi:hypothetical protein